MPFDITSEPWFPTRQEAAMCGLSRFSTGRPCKFGHLAERYVSNGQCVQCNAEKSAERDRKRRAADPSYRMFRSVQNRSGQVLKGRASPSMALGCTQETLTRHIAERFTEGMTWDRYGQWEVDHIIPLSAARALDHLIELCHYTKLQTMPLVDIEVIEGVFNSDQKAQMIEKVTNAMVEVEGEKMRGVTWVRVKEVRSGQWGIGGKTPSADDIKAMAAE